MDDIKIGPQLVSVIYVVHECFTFENGTNNRRSKVGIIRSMRALYDIKIENVTVAWGSLQVI